MMAAEKTECLFIGGPADGKFIEVRPGIARVNIPAMVDRAPGFGAITYRREELKSAGRIYTVYVVDDIPGADVVGRLIAGYGVANKS